MFTHLKSLSDAEELYLYILIHHISDEQYQLPECNIIDIDEPPWNQTTLPNELLPTMAEEPQPQCAIYPPPTQNLPTLYALLAETPRWLPVIIPETPPNEPEVWLTPTLKRLLTAPPKKHLHADFKMPPVGPTATQQPGNLPGSRQNATSSLNMAACTWQKMS